MSHVIVLCGGVSGEREVSLRSGAAVAAALRAGGHEVDIFDTDCADSDLVHCELVFPVLHGVGGEDGQIQERLEKLGKTYIGSDSTSSKLCMNKDAYRKKMVAAGFMMANGETVTYDEYIASDLSKKPHVLKPVNGGSSLDTYIIRDISNFDISAPKSSFEVHGHMLIEELIIGTEVTVGVLGNTALPIIEIVPPVDGEFDYENKYNGRTQELIPPLHVSAAAQKAAQKLAACVHSAAGCRDLSRSDFIISTNDTIYLLETNTIPGMTEQSLFPKMAAAIGLDMPGLCNRLVEFALNRR